MKIVMTSYRFAPEVGGIETVSALLAAEFERAGHEVRLITQTSEDDDVVRSYRVVRCPNVFELLRHSAWCDVFFQNNISLNFFWAGQLLFKPRVVAHHTWIGFPGFRRSMATRLKRLLIRFTHNIVVSDALLAHIEAPGTVIGNPYQADVFRLYPEEARVNDLAFLGRLVSDKGIDLLLDAVALLAARGLRPRLTIIGSGPEERALRGKAEKNGLAKQVEFVGSLTGESLARLLNRHRLLVVPSRWVEPFGLVALEAIACGCVVIGADRGGLPGAIGRCGQTFASGDASALAATMEPLLEQGEAALNHFRRHAAAHLAAHSVTQVAKAYLEVFARAMS